MQRGSKEGAKREQSVQRKNKPVLVFDINTCSKNDLNGFAIHLCNSLNIIKVKLKP
jgi:hypothetical protein